VGERIADAHEWEGACEGDLQPPDYPFELARGVSPDVGIGRMRAAHNKADAPTKRWSYGPEYKTGICATSSSKTRGATGKLDGLRLEYLSRRGFSSVPQSA